MRYHDSPEYKKLVDLMNGPEFKAEAEKRYKNLMLYGTTHPEILERDNGDRRIAELEAAIKYATEYGEVSFLGVNMPFKAFKRLKEVLGESKEIDK